MESNIKEENIGGDDVSLLYVNRDYMLQEATYSGEVVYSLLIPQTEL